MQRNEPVAGETVASGGPGWFALAAGMLLMLSAWVQFTAVAETRQDGAIHGDATKYVFYAYNLKHHQTFSRVQSFGPGRDASQVVPDKLTLPGYPLFLTLFLGDGVPDPAFVRRATYAQAALGVVSTLLGLAPLRAEPPAERRRHVIVLLHHGANPRETLARDELRLVNGSRNRRGGNARLSSNFSDQHGLAGG